METKNISYNFHVAKILSILMVATGHYFGGVLWLPTTFALFVFGFSSGFFTARKYQGGFNLKKFWYSKVIRLLPSLLVINIFLLVLFLFQSREGIISWQTVISMFGLSGFFTWFKLPNPSPFGNGLWFFTLLLVYYAIYPLISWINREKVIAIIFLIISLFITVLFSYVIPMGHALWITVFAFIFGSYSGKYNYKISAWISIIMLLLTVIALLVANIIYGFNQLNYLLIIVASFSIVSYLLNGSLPHRYLNKITVLSGSIIHIYFIHTYLFMRGLSNYKVIDYIASMIVVIFVAYFLNKVESIRLKT